MARAFQISLLRSLIPNEGRPPTLPVKLPVIAREVEKRSGRRVAFLVESGLGREIDLTDSDWRAEAGKVDIVVTGKPEILYDSDLILTTKQPTLKQLSYFRKGQGWSGFLHEEANQKVADDLRKIGVLLMPWEKEVEILKAMSKIAGEVVPIILDRFSREVWKKDWRGENAFFLGARGTVCRHEIAAMRRAGWQGEIYGCDVVAGRFTTDDTGEPHTYETFTLSSKDEVLAALQVCKIVEFAALDSNGKAPKVITREHLAVLPRNAIIMQAAIDNGGNVACKGFEMLTYWPNCYFYRIYMDVWRRSVCNIPNRPGAIAPKEASVVLAEANFEYLCTVISTFPSVSQEYVSRN